MGGARLLRILAQFDAGAKDGPGPARLCEVCAEVAVMTGAGIMLMSDDVARGLICSSDEVSAVIGDLQFTLGEGPCVDAYNEDQPVVEPDLADAGVRRWVAFTPRALDAGVRAVFGFPLRVGASRIGALNLYRDNAGPLTEEQYADTVVMASVAARAVLGMQAGARPGRLGSALESDADFRLVVHQASGMVSAQLEVSAGEALVRLRAYAFANDLPLDAVARDVVGRRLRFTDPPASGDVW
jgi:hypothetical protein